MHSLFWKILLSFWGALTLFSAATVWTASEYLEHERAQQFVTNPQQRLMQHLLVAQEIAEHRGVEGLKQWARDIDRREAVPFLLLNENGEDLLGRPVPARMAERMQRVRGFMRRNNHAEHEAHENEHRLPRYLRYVVRIPGNGVVRLAPDYQSITLGRVLSRPRVIALPVVVAALISGLVALLLARYLTAPISQLRIASRRLAEGDLAQRVRPSMGSRKDEIADLAGDFDYMAERLQALIASHKQLLRDASHELRSPLARLQVALGLTRQHAGDELGVQLDRMEKEIEDLNELIGQLLSLARLETGTATVTREPIDLPAMLETIADDATFEAQAGGKDVRLVHTVPVTLHGNGALLHSAIENVVRNAVRHTAEGTSVEIALDYSTTRSGYCVLTVRDRGPGIPEDMLTRIFEPFTRVGEARDRRSGGYGLGLAIADRAVRLHGGTLSAANHPEGGATLRFELPERGRGPS